MSCRNGKGSVSARHSRKFAGATRQQRPDDALAAYDNALRYRAENPVKVLYTVGLIEGSTGREHWPEAIERFQRAVAIDEASTIGYIYLGRCLAEAGRFDEAETALAWAELSGHASERTRFGAFAHGQPPGGRALIFFPVCKDVSMPMPGRRRCAEMLVLFGGILCGQLGCTDRDTANESEGRPWFENQADLGGIDYRHDSGFEDRYLLPQITGSGAALADLDGDGDLDAYLVQSGGGLAGGTARAGNRLYFNEGDGRFTAAPDSHGADDHGYGMGVASGDYDNDGDIDLYVTNVGPNVLLRNDGSGRFDDVTGAAGVGDSGWGTSAAFIDLDSDGDLDLFLANYINWSLFTELECYIAGLLTYCPPQSYHAPTSDRLYRNNGDGTFTDVAEHAGLNEAYGNGFGVVGADFNRDGRTDVFVANDMMVNQLWLNRGELVLDEEAMLWSCAVDEQGLAKAGMGVATGDIDDDGDTDLLVVNLEGQSDSLYRNEGSWFEDATQDAGLAASSRRYTRFGVVLADFDNDTRLDLYQANGRVGPGETRDGDLFREPNVLYRGTMEGRFEEVEPVGGTVPILVHTSRGVAVGDVDDDGGLDLLVVNRDAPPYLLMNRVAGRGNWIRFRVRVREGRDAHGASVSALVGSKRLHRRVQPEGSYLSSNDPRVHFGLGAEAAVQDVTVRWPSGGLETFGAFNAGRVVELREGSGRPATP